MAIKHILSALSISCLSLIMSIAFLVTATNNTTATRYIYLSWVTISAALVWAFCCSGLVLCLRERKMQNELEKGVEWMRPKATIHHGSYPNDSQRNLAYNQRAQPNSSNPAPATAPSSSTSSTTSVPLHPPIRFSPWTGLHNHPTNATTLAPVPLTWTPSGPKHVFPNAAPPSQPPSKTSPTTTHSKLPTPPLPSRSPIFHHTSSLSRHATITKSLSDRSCTSAELETATLLTVNIIAAQTTQNVNITSPSTRSIASFKTGPGNGGSGGGGGVKRSVRIPDAAAVKLTASPVVCH